MTAVVVDTSKIHIPYRMTQFKVRKETKTDTGVIAL